MRLVDVDGLAFEIVKEKRFIFSSSDPQSAEFSLRIMYRDIQNYIRELPTAYIPMRAEEELRLKIDEYRKAYEEDGHIEDRIRYEAFCDALKLFNLGWCGKVMEE